MLHDLLFIDRYFTDGKLPEAFFTTLYLATLFVVLQGLIMYPPRLWSKPSGARPALA